MARPDLWGLVPTGGRHTVITVPPSPIPTSPTGHLLPCSSSVRGRGNQLYSPQTQHVTCASCQPPPAPSDMTQTCTRHAGLFRWRCAQITRSISGCMPIPTDRLRGRMKNRKTYPLYWNGGGLLCPPVRGSATEYKATSGGQNNLFISNKMIHFPPGILVICCVTHD